MTAHNEPNEHADEDNDKAKHDSAEHDREEVNEAIVAADDTGMLANARSLTEEFEREAEERIEQS